jgi:hypothetical protein
VSGCLLHLPLKPAIEKEFSVRGGKSGNADILSLRERSATISRGFCVLSVQLLLLTFGVFISGVCLDTSHRTRPENSRVFGVRSPTSFVQTEVRSKNVRAPMAQ